jgi:hypothetical protein
MTENALERQVNQSFLATNDLVDFPFDLANEVSELLSNLWADVFRHEQFPRRFWIRAVLSPSLSFSPPISFVGSPEPI